MAAPDVARLLTRGGVHVLEQALRQDISPYFWHNGQYPDSGKDTALSEDTFADYRLRINGLVNNPVDLSMVQLRTNGRRRCRTPRSCARSQQA
jgi:sulfoxide reductase catalytic subunit YedY